jgi:mannose-6-phosphate isomerase-like protein (cupin superfamily)
LSHSTAHNSKCQPEEADQYPSWAVEAVRKNEKSKIRELKTMSSKPL